MIVIVSENKALYDKQLAKFTNSDKLTTFRNTNTIVTCELSQNDLNEEYFMLMASFAFLMHRWNFQSLLNDKFLSNYILLSMSQEQ